MFDLLLTAGALLIGCYLVYLLCVYLSTYEPIREAHERRGSPLPLVGCWLLRRQISVLG